MRVVLFAGKGGVGKTTIAAATAAHAAALGRKTLVVSTDAAHSLGDALGVVLTEDPLDVDGGLHAAQVDTQRSFERSWHDVQRYLLAVLDAGGVDPVDAAELTVLPGAEEVLEVRDPLPAVSAETPAPADGIGDADWDDDDQDDDDPDDAGADDELDDFGS